MVDFLTLSDGNMHEYNVDLTENGKWTGTITELVFVPTDADKTSLDKVAADIHNEAVLNTPGPVLLIPNHQSLIDWLFLGVCLEDDWKFVVSSVAD